ncbi:arginine--tRNA ligase [bacterium]|jgi:arginyl-tRNA synthetase|nr:arginine--tRNA ligase [bacterium]MBT4250987.1 arginine--tRNA ligase [bacterium]MBT4597781.1 arginine--tRNA ligase [bacterium]MBT7037412.1 arginine--tRNA ligase [bacterium]MBT7431269.1 arginine--tRNA ligase [bacterium]
MKNKLQKLIFEIVNKIYDNLEISQDEIEINHPPEGFGDFSCNIGMQLASKLKRGPFEITQEIEGEIKKTKFANDFERIEAVKPGFLNLSMTEEAVSKEFLQINEVGEKYGFSEKGAGKKVMIEFGQPNTHKAFHVGHLRSAISGLSVTRLFEILGYEVVKANYYGDVGMHVAKSTWGMKQYGLPDDFEGWDVHKRMELINDMYVEGSRAFNDDEKAEKEIRQVNKNIYQKEGKDYELYQKLRAWSLQHQAEAFSALGVEYDRQYPESEVYEDAMKIVTENKGTLFTKSEGAFIYDGEKEGLTTWVFETSEGIPTYSAKDLALGVKKFEEFDLDFSVITTSVEQTDYFKVIIHCLEKLHPELKGKYKHVPFGWLLKDNKKTSSRGGGVIKGMDMLAETRAVAGEKISVDSDYDEKTRNDIMDKVALAGLKFLILSHEFHNKINYNPEEFMKLSGFSGPFILYSSVRIKSILRKFEIEKELSEEEFLGLEKQKEEIDLIKKMMLFPEVVESAQKQIAPHLICRYLYELSQKFNLFYGKCSIQKAQSEELKTMRLMLAKNVEQILVTGLWTLGIEAPEKM